VHPDYETGEWIINYDHGAYQIHLSCNFNGFEIGATHYKFD